MMNHSASYYRFKNVIFFLFYFWLCFSLKRTRICLLFAIWNGNKYYGTGTTIVEQGKVCFLVETDLWSVSIRDWRLNRHNRTNWLRFSRKRLLAGWGLRNNIFTSINTTGIKTTFESGLRHSRKILDSKWSIKCNDGKSRFQLLNITPPLKTHTTYNILFLILNFLRWSGSECRQALSTRWSLDDYGI